MLISRKIASMFKHAGFVNIDYLVKNKIYVSPSIILNALTRDWRKYVKPLCMLDGGKPLDPNFGEEGEGAASNSLGNRIRGIKATCPETGTADSITAELSNWNAGKKVKCALHKTSDNSFVGTTEERSEGGADGWYVFNFVAPKPNLENIEYYIGAWSSYYTYLYWVSGIGFSDPETYNGFPDPLNPVANSERYSIYCSYTTVGGQTYEIFKDAVVKASAVKSLQTTFNIEKEAIVAGSAVHGEESTLNILKDAIVKSLADLGVETTFCVEKDAIVNVLADVTVEKLAGQIIEIFKDAVVQAQASFSLESIFNINKDAVAEATATFDMETIFNVVKDAIVKASASPQVLGIYPINVDAVVKASAAAELQQTLGISKDAVVVAVSTPLIQSTFNIRPEAVVKVLAEVIVTKEKVEVIKLFLVLSLEHDALLLSLQPHGDINLSLETPYIIELEVN